MKKSVLLLFTTAAIISLTAFNFINKELPTKVETKVKEPKLPFFYDYGTRFSGITKTAILKATSVTDFFPKEHADRIVSYDKVMLVIIKNERQTEIRAYSKGPKLSVPQLKILQDAELFNQF